MFGNKFTQFISWYEKTIKDCNAFSPHTKLYLYVLSYGSYTEKEVEPCQPMMAVPFAKWDLKQWIGAFNAPIFASLLEPVKLPFTFSYNLCQYERKS